MKNRIVKMLLVAGFIVFITAGCESEETFSYHMSATIEGYQWRTLMPATIMQNDKFVITGTSLNGKVLTLTIIGSKPGTYSFLKGKCMAVYKDSPTLSDDDAFASISGEVSLTEVDEENKKLSGTFSFKMVKKDDALNPLYIQQGVFDGIKYAFGNND